MFADTISRALLIHPGGFSREFAAWALKLREALFSIPANFLSEQMSIYRRLPFPVHVFEDTFRLPTKKGMADITMPRLPWLLKHQVFRLITEVSSPKEPTLLERLSSNVLRAEISSSKESVEDDADISEDGGGPMPRIPSS